MKNIYTGKIPKSILEFLSMNNYSVTQLENNSKVNPNIANHIDLSVLKINEQIFIIDDDQRFLIEKLKSKGLNVIGNKMICNATYPEDCIFNFAIIGKYILGNKKCLTEILEQTIKRSCLIFKDVKQGYTKCSTLIINNNAIITDDVSIHNKASELLIDSLLVDKGDIFLNGYDYGFIGGASVSDCETKTILFFGDITKHRNYKEIDSFIKKHNYNYKFIPNYPLTDIGGAIII